MSETGTRIALRVAGLVAALILCAPVAATAQLVRLGSAPAIPAGAQALGALAADTPVTATIALRPRDPAALEAYANAVSTPGSGAYRQFLTVTQFAQRFAPTAEQLADVRAALGSEGLTTGPPAANGLSIPLSGPASALSAAFSTPLARYRLAGGRTGFANTAAPAVGDGLAGLVQGVAGLDTLTAPAPLIAPGPGRRASAANALTGDGVTSDGVTSDGVTGDAVSGDALAANAVAPCAPAAAAASADGGYTADQIASAYGYGSLYGAGDVGAGATVALFELAPYDPADVAGYQACYGTAAPVTNVVVDGPPAATFLGDEEATLDIEDVIGLAPGASIRVYEGPNSPQGAYDTLSRVVSDDAATVVSSSWGECEAQVGPSMLQAENTLLQEAAAQGQSVFAAAGDSGSDDCGSGAQAVDDPGSQPFATGVGGTTLPSPSSAGAETVWNGPSGAGGGGASSQWPAPADQANFAVAQTATTCGATTSCREVPDVSADADPATGYAIEYGGTWTTVGGTSAATPTWAALAALAESSAVCAGGRIGLAGPALYRAAGTGYAGSFFDITAGDNAFGGVPGFAAGPGYDMASGLGAPVGAALAPALCGDVVTAATPAQSSTVGAATSVALQASSSVGAALAYTATDLPPGLSLNSVTGVVSGTPTAPGAYAVAVAVSDGDGAVGDQSLQWRVAAAPQAAAPAAHVANPIVLLGRPRAQSGRVGARARLALTAGDSAGLRLGYAAAGLPPGLSINAHSGVIAGAPRRSGSYRVMVSARDGYGGSAAVRFGWRVAGAPRATARSLTVLSHRHVRLSLTVAAGRDAPAIQRLVLAPAPGTVMFAGAPAAETMSFALQDGALAVSPHHAARQLTVTLQAPHLTLAGALATSLAHGGRPTVHLMVTVVDARRTATILAVSLTAS